MRLLDRAALQERGIPYGRVHLWRLEKAGKFPKRVALSSSRIAWIESEIDAWIGARVTARNRSSRARP
jgi:prophage regulatory protein